MPQARARHAPGLSIIARQRLWLFGAAGAALLRHAANPRGYNQDSTLLSAFAQGPGQLNEKWGLPADYPMVAPNYAKKRSTLARQIGLGTGGRKR